MKLSVADPESGRPAFPLAETCKLRGEEDKLSTMSLVRLKRSSAWVYEVWRIYHEMQPVFLIVNAIISLDTP